MHFWRITYPNSIVFDEVTFGKFLNSYAKGEYYFDLHPPLGKLIFGWMAFWGGINPQFNYDKIGTVFTENTYIWLRSSTAFGGALIAPCLFMLLRGLRYSLWVAIVAALFVIFENALIVISRTFVFDVFILSFGFLSLAFGIWYHRTDKQFLWWLAWIFAGAAFSIKWTGLSFLGVLSLWEIQKVWDKVNRSSHLNESKQKKTGSKNAPPTRTLPALIFIFRLREQVYKVVQMVWEVRQATGRIIVGFATAFSLYFLVFVIHFAWTPRAGIGNDFMTPDFQSGLIGNRFYGDKNLKPPGAWGQFTELNHLMWFYQKTMNQPHPYSSAWYTWPFLYRPIYFWGNTDSALKERIYLLGNPLLWWSALAATLYFLYRRRNFWRFIFRPACESQTAREANILVLFIANYLPFVFIGRVMFLYHYMVALTVALAILAVVLERWKEDKRLWVFLFAAFASFCFFAPLTYALPLNDFEYQWRLWFSTWL